ncbi:protein of unknown function [Dyella sp. OK004]|nr:protein of unknown function [Dyella sp. OK004]
MRILGSMLLLCGLSHAQQSCEWRQEGPMGPAWYQPGSWSACGVSQQQVQPGVRWATRWGSIAYSSKTGSLGTTFNQESKREAELAAMKRCGSSRDITDCKIISTYFNQCAAVAWGGGVEGSGTGPTIAEASKASLRSCQDGGTDCKVIFSECSLPERIQ